MIEMVEPPNKQALQHDAGRADDDWREQQGPPIADAEIGQQHPGRERAQHVLRAMSEVDDVEQAENDRKPQAENRIERAVYQAEQKLAEQRLGRNTEEFEHGRVPAQGTRRPSGAPLSLAVATSRAGSRPLRADGRLSRRGGAPAGYSNPLSAEERP